MTNAAEKARKARLTAAKRLIETHGSVKPNNVPETMQGRPSSMEIKMVPKKVLKVRTVSV
jgi:hypothetical protein